MERHCVSCKINTGNENLNVKKTKQNRLMLLSNCAVCGKKINFYEKLRTPLSNIQQF